MDRREFLGTAGLAAAAIHARANAPQGGRRRPNVIYAFSDEHRWQSIEGTEQPGLHTPNMVRLAAQSTSFQNCISNYPVCSPYRAMLLTGRWPWQTGVDDNGLTLSPSEITLGKVFKEAGYATGYIGKWHLSDGFRAEPYGYDHSLLWGSLGKHWDESRYFPKDADPVRPKGYNATLMTDQALEFIEQKKDVPFFLTLSWHPPHAVFTDPPEAKKALYPEGSLPRRANTPTDTIKDGNSVFDYGWPIYQGYHGHISAIDDELGRLMAKLDELGIAEDTILIYTSDHGSMMGSQGLGGKRQPYEESIRVPLMVRWPGVVPAGRQVDALIGTIDLFPTLCGIAGVEIPDGRMGMDCSAWLQGKEGPRQKAQLIMHLNKDNASKGKGHPAPLFHGLRTTTHTYAERDGQPWILYDLATDPLQKNNLVNTETVADLQKIIKTDMSALVQKHKAPWA